MSTFAAPAVVGSGFIGTSWARLMARAGLDVRLYDPDPAQLDAARASLDAGVTFCDTLDAALAGADYVQESVSELLEVKRRVFAEIDALAAPGAPIGSSTSAFPISAIAAGVSRPRRCLVVHPTNPPHIVPLVELVPGPETDPELTRRVHDFMVELGQEPILCNKEIDGFVLNRLQFALLREAFALVRDGVASAVDVDKTVRHGLGLRWAFLGPYGVEATNAESIEDDLRKFGDLMRGLFADVCRPFDGPDERDIAAAVAAVSEMFGDATQEQLLEYRDRMVTRLRAIKQSEPSPYG